MFICTEQDCGPAWQASFSGIPIGLLCIMNMVILIVEPGDMLHTPLLQSRTRNLTPLIDLINDSTGVVFLEATAESLFHFQQSPSPTGLNKLRHNQLIVSRAWTKQPVAPNGLITRGNVLPWVRDF